MDFYSMNAYIDVSNSLSDFIEIPSPQKAKFCTRVIKALEFSLIYI